MKNFSSLFILLLGYAAAASAGAADFSTYPNSCKIQVLRHLGWQIQPQISATIDFPKTGSACDLEATSIESRGNLTEDLNRALQSSASLCSYKGIYQVALRTATKKLANNHFYSFDSAFHSGEIRLDGVDGWERSQCIDNDKCFVPEANNFTLAFQSLYSASYASECATGLQLAEYATIHELFQEKMSGYFQAQEIYVGDWQNIKNSKSAIHGSNGRKVRDIFGKSYGQKGYLSLIGVPGYIGETLISENNLDSSINRNENFIIVQTTSAAAQSLYNHGGLMYYFKLLASLQKITKDLSEQDLLNLENFPDTTWLVSPAARQVHESLQDPFLRDTIVYVHPAGFRSLANHILRLARMNPQMPYAIMFYPEATNGEIFDRWLKFQLDSCEISKSK